MLELSPKCVMYVRVMCVMCVCVCVCVCVLDRLLSCGLIKSKNKTKKNDTHFTSKSARGKEGGWDIHDLLMSTRNLPAIRAKEGRKRHVNN